MTDHFEIHFLELEKFTKQIKINDKLYKWLYYFKYEGLVEEEEMQIIIKDDVDLQKADKEYKKFNYDNDLKEIYEARFKYKLDYNTDIYLAEQKGIEKGIEEGIEKGKIETAIRLIKKGFDINEISEITGLSIAEIDKLKV